MTHFLTFPNSVTQSARRYVVKAIENVGLSVSIDPSEPDFVVIRASFDSLVEEGEREGIDKPLNNQQDEVIIDHKIPLLARLEKSKIDAFVGSHERSTFFTPSEQARLTWNILRRIPTREKELAILGHDVAAAHVDEPLVVAAAHATPPLVDVIRPLHVEADSAKRSEIERDVIFKSFVASRSAVEKIRDYFGEEVGLYFVWMDFLGKMLTVPALLGVVFYLFRPEEANNVAEDPYMPIFSAFMALWSIAFLVLWRCRCSEFAFHWTTYDYEKIAELNPFFKGTSRVSPVTGKMEKHFSYWRRLARYAVSLGVTFAMIVLAVAAMAVSLNLNGYVKDTNSPIYLASLAVFAAPGGPFAADSPYYAWLIPSVGHTIAIFVLNYIYSFIAVSCTHYENHKYMLQWKNSLIAKRVFFEALDCFIAPHYITFYQRDVVSLRQQMIGLFWCDEFRRVGLETALPFAISQIRKRVSGNKLDKNIIANKNLEHYEQFVDYLEMVIQFGYVTLFAAALPLAAIVSILFIVLETRSDIWKLLHGYMRPRARQACDLGVWYYVMLVMVVLSMLTNSFIAFVSSDQMVYWLPGYRDNPCHSWIMAFSVEHVLVFLVFVAHAYLPKQFGWVKAAIARRSYRKKHLNQTPAK
ncbi:anoctamin-10-like isoform X2 [Oscarella lobularis]|uniref:anoctamin-10-like isoform X2 n=1 Tax=Oscarella lobularis TaxID=121494 RepID=UPI003313EBD9